MKGTDECIKMVSVYRESQVDELSVIVYSISVVSECIVCDQGNLVDTRSNQSHKEGTV